MNIFTPNRLLDNSFYSNNSSKRSISSINKSNLTYNNPKYNTNYMYQMNYNQMNLNSFSKNYSPNYSTHMNKNKKYINTEPNLDSDIKLNTIKETSKNLQKRLDILINKSKNKNKKLLEERNQELGKTIYYRPNSNQKIPNYQIMNNQFHVLKNENSFNNLNLLNHNQYSFSLNRTNSNNSFSHDINLERIRSASRNYNKKSFKILPENRNRMNYKNYNQINKINGNKINTPDKVITNNLNSYYLAHSSIYLLNKLKKFQTTTNLRKSKNKNDSSDLSDLADDFVEAFDLEKKSNINKEKELIDLRKDLNIKIFKHFEGDENENIQGNKNDNIKLKNDFIFKNNKKINKISNNKKNQPKINIKNDFIFNDKKNKINNNEIKSIEPKNIETKNLNINNNFYNKFNEEEKKSIEDEINNNKYNNTSINYNNFIDSKKNLEQNTIYLNKYKNEDYNLENEKNNKIENNITKNQNIRYENEDEIDNNNKIQENKYVAPVIMSLESVDMYSDKQSDILETRNSTDIKNSNNKVKNPFIQNEHEIKKKEQYDSDEEADLIINQIIQNANKHNELNKKNKNNEKKVDFKLDSNININYYLNDEPFKLKISNSSSPIPKEFKERNMDEYIQILRNSNKLKPIIKQFDKDKILIDKDYISAELKTEEELLPNIDLKSNLDENSEQYEYYPLRNEINSLDSIEI